MKKLLTAICILFSIIYSKAQVAIDEYPAFINLRAGFATGNDTLYGVKKNSYVNGLNFGKNYSFNNNRKLDLGSFFNAEFDFAYSKIAKKEYYVRIEGEFGFAAKLEIIKNIKFYAGIAPFAFNVAPLDFYFGPNVYYSARIMPFVFEYKKNFYSYFSELNSGGGFFQAKCILYEGKYLLGYYYRFFPKNDSNIKVYENGIVWTINFR